jgi:rare lipoprotein A
MRRLLLILLATAATGCATTGAGPGGIPPAPRGSATGLASYVGPRYEGRMAASGVRFDGQAMVAAHRTLPFGTRVRVTNLANGRSVVVTVVDRGPFRGGRVIDVSGRAASELGFVREGLARVRLDVVDAEPRAADE